MARLPHALRHVDSVLARLEDLQRIHGDLHIALFVDYDGTLSPIVSNPSQATLTPTVRALLARLTHLPDVHLTIVSGRALHTLLQPSFVALPPHTPPPSTSPAQWRGGLTYASSHGFAITGAAGALDAAAEVRPLLAASVICLRTQLAAEGFTGTEVEDNVASVSVHFRNLHDPTPERLARVHELVTQHAQEEGGGGLEVRGGKLVWELRAKGAVPWGKGHAVRAVLRMLGAPLEQHQYTWPSHASLCSSGTVATSPPLVAVCLGDDETDEDMFKALAVAVTEGALVAALTVLIAEPMREEHHLITPARAAAIVPPGGWTAARGDTTSHGRDSFVDNVGEEGSTAHATVDCIEADVRMTVACFTLPHPTSVALLLEGIERITASARTHCITVVST